MQGSATASGEFHAGVVIPGLCNAHSHAFQRALVGRTRLAIALSMSGSILLARRYIALRQVQKLSRPSGDRCSVYSEMLAAGYMSVGYRSLRLRR